MSLKVNELKTVLEPLGYAKIYREFFLEASLFADMVCDEGLDVICEDFNDFIRYLSKRSRKIVGNTKVAALSKGSNILRAEGAAGELKSILAYSQVAACCELFNGWTFILAEDMKQGFATELEQKLEHLKSADVGALNEIYLRIATADTVRIVTLLKMLGLIQPDSSKKRILSFGAASGVKELYATHTEPRLVRSTAVSGSTAASRYQLGFSRNLKWPSQTVLIDYDAHWQAHYENITATHAANVLGVLGEFDKVIQEMPAILKRNSMEPADLVLGWRIDHQVIPDVPHFFKSIMPSLSSSSKLDLVITIGAGDDDEDFAGRVNTMDAIWDFLKACGLAPVRILLHGEGRDYPLLGHGSYATYEVIYCQLNKRKIKNTLS